MKLLLPVVHPTVTFPVVGVIVNPVELEPATETEETPPLPLAAAVIWPCALTVMLADVYDPGVTEVLANEIVPLVVIVPPLKPVPAVILVTPELA